MNVVAAAAVVAVSPITAVASSCKSLRISARFLRSERTPLRIARMRCSSIAAPQGEKAAGSRSPCVCEPRNQGDILPRPTPAPPENRPMPKPCSAVVAFYAGPMPKPCSAVVAFAGPEHSKGIYPLRSGRGGRGSRLLRSTGRRSLRRRSRRRHQRGTRQKAAQLRRL